MKFTLLLAPGGLYKPVSTHATIPAARRALRAYPKQLAAQFRGNENTVGRLSYLTHFAIAKGVIPTDRPSTHENWEEVDALIVERWAADRKSAERE